MEGDRRLKNNKGNKKMIHYCSRKVILGIILFTLNVFLITIIVLFVMKIPQIIYWKQDKNILENVQRLEIDTNWISFRGTRINMTDEEKIEMIEKKEDSIITVSLETGNMYSLYEARKRCFDEMNKIPVIEMDIYGPVKDEINIEPILYINGKSPSQSMIVWSGTVEVKNITYSVMLEEESGKILAIKGDGLDNNFNETLIKEWKEYMYGTTIKGQTI